MVFARTLLLASMLCLAAGSAPSTASAATEDEIKAEVAFNILKFVKWPAASLSAGQPLALCVAESSGLGKLLARYAGARVGDNNLAFKLINRHLDGLDDCQAVFVAAGDPYAVLRISAATQGKAILLLAEGDRALQQGAGIGISLAGNHVVIDVDLSLLNASGLAVSSKLLRLARTVIK
jgi:hypothetical protein